MKCAYYSRNNSYSRSYNAERAEKSGRLPLTRAAKYLGLSVAAFKGGCEAIGYQSNEWHHVGKYATQVAYYDTAELSEDYKFWKGAKTKANKEFVATEITRCLKAVAKENIEEKFRYIRYEKKSRFANALKRKCEGNPKMLEAIVQGCRNSPGKGDTQYIAYGETYERDQRVTYDGRVYEVGEPCLNTIGCHIRPFNLSKKGWSKKIREISMKKFSRFMEKDFNRFTYSFNPGMVKRIIDRVLRKEFVNNSLADATFGDRLAAAKIITKLHPGDYCYNVVSGSGDKLLVKIFDRNLKVISQ